MNEFILDYRIAVASDLKNINNIRHKIDCDPNSPQGAPPLNSEDIIETDRSLSILALKYGCVIGYVSLFTQNSDSFEYCSCVEFKVYVLPTEQRNKVATKLINKIEEYASQKTNAKYIELGVSNTNLRAKKLYLTLGFTTFSSDSAGETMRKKINR